MRGQRDEVRSVRRRSLVVVCGAALLLCTTGCRGLAAADEPSRLSFGLMSDAQYCDRDPAGSRFYGESKEKLAAAVEDLNAQGLAFTIHLGDFIDAHDACLDALLPVYERLSMPHFHALGNHDFDVSAETKSAVPEKLGLKERYYSFVLAGRRFVVLDGGDVSLYARAAGSEERALAEAMLAELKAAGAAQAQGWNGAVGAEQLAWLKRTLSEAYEADEQVIVFCHFPVYPPGAHNLWNDSAVIEALESGGSVVAYINGHNHAGAHAVKNGIHYLTVHGMVETADTTAYAVVHVDATHLEVDGRGRQPDQVLEYGAPDTP